MAAGNAGNFGSCDTAHPAGNARFAGVASGNGHSPVAVPPLPPLPPPPLPLPAAAAAAAAAAVVVAVEDCLHWCWRERL